jgi:probable rRNA maturation factor
LKNVFVYCENSKIINKLLVHSVISKIRNNLSLKIKSLEINFVSQETIRKVNNEFLSHDYSTDIITFDYSNERNILDGEIIISLKDAEENSKKYQVTFDNELLRLIIHGILHLLGYDDITLSKRKVMKKAENDITDNLSKYSKGLVNFK